MSTKLLTTKIWPQLTAAANTSNKSSFVAVAYFGQGASQLLPLRKGSVLVVDASEGAVAAGQTCPAELAKLMRSGVRVFGVPNLHGKVFVFGKSAFIGSTNASRRSASQLVEAVIQTTDRTAVRSARQFIQDLCLHELSPTVIDRLKKLYRPPKLKGGKRRQKVHAVATEDPDQPTLPRVTLAQLVLGSWSARDQIRHDKALPVAKKRRKHPRSFVLESFRWHGRCPFRRGDVVIQITDEGRNQVLVSPPGNILHTRTHADAREKVTFVYLERPDRKRRAFNRITRSFSRITKQGAHRSGLVHNRSLARALLGIWSK